MHNSWSVIRTNICLLSHDTVYTHAILIPLAHLFAHVSCLRHALSHIVSRCQWPLINIANSTAYIIYKYEDVSNSGVDSWNCCTFTNA